MVELHQCFENRKHFHHIATRLMTNKSSSSKGIYCPDHKYFLYEHIFFKKHWLPISFTLFPFSYCTGPFKEMHQEFQQITGPSVFDQQFFRRGLLQRNNFPLHFLSWTKTPLKWMAFAHSLWPQLAVLLPTLVLWPLNRQAADEGRQKGLTRQVQKHMKRLNASIRLDKVLFDLFTFVLFLGVADFLWFFSFFPPNIRIKSWSEEDVWFSFFALLDHRIFEKHCGALIINRGVWIQKETKTEFCNNTSRNTLCYGLFVCLFFVSKLSQK